MEVERSYHFDHWLHHSKNMFAIWFYAHIFHDFIHVYSLGRFRQPIWANILKSTERPRHFNLWFYIHPFMIQYMYISPGQGQTTPRWKKVDVNRNILSLRLFVTFYKQFLWSLILYTFLMILYMHIAPGQGHKTPLGQTVDVNRKVLSLCLFAASFKKISLKSDFIHIFSCFYTYI